MHDAFGFYPPINQIEFHPYWQAREVVAFCNKNGILVEAYAPMVRASGRGRVEGGRERDELQYAVGVRATRWRMKCGASVSHSIPSLTSPVSLHPLSATPPLQGDGSRSKMRDDPLFPPIAAAHNATVGQAIMRWELSTGADIVIPRSATPAHQAANLAMWGAGGVPAFELTELEIAAISSVHNYTKVRAGHPARRSVCCQHMCEHATPSAFRFLCWLRLARAPPTHPSHRPARPQVYATDCQPWC